MMFGTVVAKSTTSLGRAGQLIFPPAPLLLAHTTRGRGEQARRRFCTENSVALLLRSIFLTCNSGRSVRSVRISESQQRFASLRMLRREGALGGAWYYRRWSPRLRHGTPEGRSVREDKLGPALSATVSILFRWRAAKAAPGQNTVCSQNRSLGHHVRQLRRCCLCGTAVGSVLSPQPGHQREGYPKS